MEGDFKQGVRRALVRLLNESAKRDADHADTESRQGPFQHSRATNWTRALRRALRGLDEHTGSVECTSDLFDVHGFGTATINKVDTELRRVEGNPLGHEASETTSRLSKEDVGTKSSGSTETGKWPKRRTGSSGILIALAILHGQVGKSETFPKKTIVAKAQPYSDSSYTVAPPTARRSNPAVGGNRKVFNYTAWNCMKTLLNKNLVSKHSRNYKLTDEGILLAGRHALACGVSLTSTVDARDEVSESNFVPSPPRSNPSGSDGTGRLLNNWQDILHDCTNRLASLGLDPNIPTFIDTRSRKVPCRCQAATRKIAGRTAYRATVNPSYASLIEGGIIDISAQPKGGDDRLTVWLPHDGKACCRSASVQSSRSFSVSQLSSQIQRSLHVTEGPGASGSVRILIDNREPNKASMLRKLRQVGIDAEVRALPIGDFLWVEDVDGCETVLDFVVERKRLDDLHQSVKNKHLESQLNRLHMAGFSQTFVLLEDYGKSSGDAKVLHGVLSQLLFREMVSLLYSYGPGDTCKILETLTLNLHNHSRKALIKWEDFSDHLKSYTGPKTHNDMFILMLANVRGISLVTAECIAKQYQTLAAFVKSMRTDYTSPADAILALASSTVGGDGHGKRLGPKIAENLYSTFIGDGKDVND
eukprot:Clim_evm2s32 gene=Clim_evmTU2s32